MAAASIRVRRDNVAWRDRVRSYQVVLDGTVVGSVKRGESITVMTDAGDHELHLKIDWARSPSVQLDLESEGEAEVRCWPKVVRCSRFTGSRLGARATSGLKSRQTARGLTQLRRGGPRATGQKRKST